MIQARKVPQTSTPSHDPPVSYRCCRSQKTHILLQSLQSLSISSTRKLKSYICSLMFYPYTPYLLRDARRSVYNSCFCWSRICRCRARDIARKKGMLLGNLYSHQRCNMRFIMYRACPKNIELILSSGPES
jgi:hypothetical protein